MLGHLLGALMTSWVSLTLTGCSWAQTAAVDTISPEVMQQEVQRAEGADVLQYAQDEPGPNYIIGAGDVLDISVWRDENLSGTVVVLPDGTFSFPLVGKIAAAGKTVAELQNILEEKIERYVPEPVLTVAVQQVNSMRVFVIGKINRPGAYPMISEMDVLQVLSLAGGLNQFADRGKIKILRKQGTKTELFYFNYKDVAKGEKLEQNILLKRGDVIVVP